MKLIREYVNGFPWRIGWENGRPGIPPDYGHSGDTGGGQSESCPEGPRDGDASLAGQKYVNGGEG